MAAAQVVPLTAAAAALRAQREEEETPYTSKDLAAKAQAGALARVKVTTAEELPIP